MRYIKYIFLPVLLFVFFFTIYKNIYKKIPINYWDEQAWISHGYFFELFIKRDINNIQWQYKLLQPNLTDYLYGASVYKRYLAEKEKLGDKNYDLRKFLISYGFYDEESVEINEYKSYKNKLDYFPPWNKDDFEISSQELLNKYGQKFQRTLDILYTARSANIILLSLNVVVIYFISLIVLSFYPAILTALIFGYNYFIVSASLRAHTEGLFLFLFNLSLLLVFLTLKKSKIFAFLFALVVGLLWQTKINGIMVLGIFNFIYLLKKESLKSKILLLLCVNILTTLVFINTNFFIIKSPIKNTLLLYRFKTIESYGQAEDYPKDFLKSPLSRIIAIQKNFLLKSYYLKLIIFSKNDEIVESNFFNYFYRLIYLSGFFVGIFYAFKIFLTNSKSDIVLILIIFLLLQLIMSQYLILDWNRYYIQLGFFFIFFSVYGLTLIFKLFEKYAKSLNKR